MRIRFPSCFFFPKNKCGGCVVFVTILQTLTHSCLSGLYKSLPQEIGDTKRPHVSQLHSFRDWLHSFSRKMLGRLHHLHSNFTTCKIPRFSGRRPCQWDPNFERSSCKDPANFDWSFYTHFLHPDWSQINLSVSMCFCFTHSKLSEIPKERGISSVSK